jgi:nucleoside-diphosphate-sugar epimerase|tara:strand:+ start:163 stop:1032 length:870 start_codon:yes stop_codon:yes gene_type:complete
LEKIIKKLLIIGCGKLGQRIGDNLSELPIEITGIKRKLPNTPASFKIITLDIFSDKFLDNVKSIKPDYLIYCVSSDEQTEESYQKNYVEGLKITLNALNQLNNFQHLIFISSTRVYGQISNSFLSESTPPVPNDFRGKILLEAEGCLNKKLSFKTTVLRLSGIYGDNRQYLLRIASDLNEWPPKDRWTNRIHEDDATSFIAFLFTQLITNKKIEDLYLLTDSHPVSLYEVLKWIRLELKLSLENLPIPNGINGKKLRSDILPMLKFSLKHSDYKSGYHQMIASLGKTNG